MNEPREMTEEEELRVRLNEPLEEFERDFKEVSSDNQFYNDEENGVLEVLRRNSEIHACAIVQLNSQGPAASLPPVDSLSIRVTPKLMERLFAFVREKEGVHCEPLRELYDAPDDRSRMVFLKAITDEARNRILVVVGKEWAWCDTVETLVIRAAVILANPLTDEDRHRLGSADWWIDFLVLLAISDRNQYLPLLESPSAGLLASVIDSISARGRPSRLLGHQKRLAEFYGFVEVSVLWRVWMKTMYGPLLESAGRELVGEAKP